MQKKPIQAGWTLPLLQSITSGLIIGGAFTAAAALFGWDLKIGLLTGMIAAGLFWFGYQERWQRFTIPVPEPEPTAPQVMAAEIQAPQTVRVELKVENGADYISLPISQAKAERVFYLLSVGRDFSLASLAGPGKPLSRSEFEILRDVLIERGLAEWINPNAHNQGVKLTAAGRAIMRKFAALYQNGE